MKIRQTTIDKYYKFLKDLTLLSQNKEITDLNKIVKEYALNTYTASVMVQLGYVKKINRSKCQLLLLNPEPIHAKKLIEIMNKSREKSKSKQKINQTSKRNQKSLISKNSQKEFSLLWGLITIKF
jgi:predicted Zn-ribbon and HTH transcriptional regulator